MTDKSRRLFIMNTALLAGAALAGSRMRGLAQLTQEGQTPSDEDICKEKFSRAMELSLQEKPIGEVVVAIGISFIGTPYIANTLDVAGEERLVINLQGLDCVTFTENALSLARCLKLKRTTFEDYRQQLRLIRYRDGIIDEYPSRLHYFSDWIDNNESKNIVRNVTKQLGGLPLRKTIDYMSTHPLSYKQLENETFLGKIQTHEAALNARKHSFIPKENLKKIQSGIKNGDIVAITSSVRGMDIEHTGLAMWVGKTLKLLHASLSGGEVLVSDNPLIEYLALHQKQTGIMVARPLEPAA